MNGVDAVIPGSGGRAPRLRQALFLALALAVTRLPALLHPRAIDDEQVYAVVATEMLHGGHPYVDAVERKPPLLFYLYAAVFQIGGPYNWPLLHTTMVLWTLATMGLLYLTARRLFDHPTGLAAALLYGLFLAWADYRSLALNGEVLMNLPVAGAVYLTFRPGSGRWRPELLLAGGLVAAAFLLKQPSGIAALALGLYLLRADYRRNRGLSVGHVLVQGTLLTAGFVITLAAAALFLRRAGILDEAIYWTLGAHAPPFGVADWRFWRSAPRATALFVLECLPLLLLAALSLRAGWRGRDRWQGREPEFAGLALLLGLSAVGVSAGGQFLYHYYIQLLPPLALLAAPLLVAVMRGERPSRLRLLQPRMLAGWLGLLAVVFLTTGVIGLWRQRNPGPSAVWVRDHSSADDRIFVWGQGTRQTGIYLDARRRPASRYIALFPLTGHIFGYWYPGIALSHRIVPGAWDHLAGDFARHPPRYIIDTEAIRPRPRYLMSRYPVLWEFIAREGYGVVFRAEDGVVYGRLASADGPPSPGP